MNDDKEIVRIMRHHIDTLRQCNHLYYVMGQSLIEDSTYDVVRAKLVELEAEHPDLVQPDSPINTVGAKPESTHETKEHLTPMLSLGNIFNEEELLSYLVADQKALDDKTVQYTLEHKFDGLALSLAYEYGVFVQALTRGDGRSGEDVTNKVRTINNVPMYLEGAAKIHTLEVRGEVVMPKAGFKAFNAKALKEGKRVFSNPRNAAVGSLRQKSNDEPRPLAFYAYSMNEGRPKDITTQSGAYDWLKDNGFSIGEFVVVRGLSMIQKYYDSIIEKRESLPYDIDGMVIKVDSFEKQDVLGEGVREPNWAVAYKFPAKTTITTLRGVEWQVGRMGQITPVGKVEPVEVGGVTISNVTLHNVAELERLGIRINDQVTLERAGDVIPKITSVWTELRPKDTSAVVIPKRCPSCGSDTDLTDNNNLLYCTNTVTCPAQRLGTLSHFVSRNAMDIDGLATATIERFIEEGLVEGYDDFYQLKDKTDILYLIEGLGTKSIDKILRNIELSKEVTLKRFIYALGIHNVGEGTSLRLERHYGTLEALLATSEEELNTIVDIGPITARQIYTFIRNPESLRAISNLLNHGVNPIATVKPDTSGLEYDGQTWVITGKFDKPRDKIKEELEAKGASVSNTVNQNTTVLLSDGTSSSKLTKAKKLGIPVVSIF